MSGKEESSAHPSAPPVEISNTGSATDPGDANPTPLANVPTPYNVPPYPTQPQPLYQPQPQIATAVPLGAPPQPAPVHSAAPSPYNEPPPSYQAATGFSTTAPTNAPYAKPTPPSYNPIGQQQQFPQQNTATPVLQPQRVLVSVQTAPVGNCAYCRIGQVTNETDLCCLMCLIILTIFTFPLGLLFLCCIPCTVHRRCNHCRRIG